MNSLKTWLSNLLLKIKGKDNYLTMETFTAGAAVLVIILIIITLLISPGALKKSGSRTPTLTPTPTPTPIPLPKGPRVFGVSTSNNPQITDLRFSEYDPQIGQTQTITISVLDGQGDVALADVALKTDNKTKIYQMKLISGTVKKGDWSVDIITDDKHDYRYSLVITAKNNKGQTASVHPIFK